MYVKRERRRRLGVGGLGASCEYKLSYLESVALNLLIGLILFLTPPPLPQLMGAREENKRLKREERERVRTGEERKNEQHFFFSQSG